MNRVIATAGAIVAALICAVIVVGSGRAVAAPRLIAAGDSLVYDVTLEAQLHAIGPQAGSSMISVTSGDGTETFAIQRVDADGTAHALLTFAYRGTVNGRPDYFDKTWRVQLAPDGEIRSDGARPSLGDNLDQALAYINGLAKGLASRTLQSGATWTSTEPLGSTPGAMTITSTVTGVQSHQGFRTFVIVQTGAGGFRQSVGGSPATGNIATGGTLYYAADNRLLIGGAARGQTELALKNADIKHISATTRIDVELRAWNRTGAHSAVLPTASPSASSSPSASPIDAGAPSVLPSASPSATPTPVYTPAPSSPPTASPISTGR